MPQLADGAKIIGFSGHLRGFTVKNVHPHDVGTILDTMGVAIRTGNHCAEPLMHRFGLSATCRASLSIYNNTEDIDALAKGIKESLRLLG